MVNSSFLIFNINEFMHKKFQEIDNLKEQIADLEAQIISKKETFSHRLKLQAFLNEWEKLGIEIPTQVGRTNLLPLLEMKKKKYF